MTLSPMVRTGLFWSSVAFVAVVFTSLIGWGNLPEDGKVPLHWSASGEVNRYGSRLEAVLSVPAILLLLNVVMVGAAVLTPRKDNLEKSKGLYLSAWIGTSLLMAFAHMMIVYGGITGEVFGIEAMMAFASIVIILMGNYLAKSRPNWVAGIRTPWSLESEHAWTVSNRAAGWCFVLTGGVSLIGFMVLPINQAVFVFVAGVIASAVVGVVSSYFAWRGDPNRND